MNLYSMSDKAIRQELGERLKNLRLRQNITQQQLADATTLSLNTIKSLENGKAKLSTVIAVLRELGELEQVNQFIPEPEISPLQLARQQGKVRERASGSRDQDAEQQSENNADDQARKGETGEDDSAW